MLEVQGAKPLIVQKSKYNDLYFRNDEFFCIIRKSGIIQEDNIIYAPKCDFETYMFTWKNKTLARYLRTCIQFFGFLHPECKTIEICDKLSIRCGRSMNIESLDGCAQYFYLSNFTLPFFKQTWFVRYMNAVEKEKTFGYGKLDVSELDKKYTLGWIMGRSYVMNSNLYFMLHDKYTNICNASASIHEFFKTFTKRSRFMHCLPWLPGFIKNEMNPVYKDYIIPVYPTNTEMQSMYESIHVEEVEIDYYDECPHFEDTKNEIVIRNSIIATMLFSMEDVD